MNELKGMNCQLLQNRWRYYKIFHELTGILKKNSRCNTYEKTLHPQKLTSESLVCII